jgi:hypothetical protein
MIGRVAITTAHAPTSGCADLPYAVTGTHHVVRLPWQWGGTVKAQVGVSIAGLTLATTLLVAGCGNAHESGARLNSAKGHGSATLATAAGMYVGWTTRPRVSRTDSTVTYGRESTSLPSVTQSLGQYTEVQPIRGSSSDKPILLTQSQLTGPSLVWLNGATGVVSSRVALQGVASSKGMLVEGVQVLFAQAGTLMSVDSTGKTTTLGDLPRFASRPSTNKGTTRDTVQLTGLISLPSRRVASLTNGSQAALADLSSRNVSLLGAYSYASDLVLGGNGDFYCLAWSGTDSTGTVHLLRLNGANLAVIDDLDTHISTGAAEKTQLDTTSASSWGQGAAFLLTSSAFGGGGPVTQDVYAPDPQGAIRRLAELTDRGLSSAIVGDDLLLYGGTAGGMGTMVNLLTGADDGQPTLSPSGSQTTFVIP